MNELEAALRITLSNTFLMYYKTHSFHWNIEGKLFSQYHEFFGELYEDLYSAVDPLAEELRALNVYAPGSLSKIMNAATITESDVVGDVLPLMLTTLLKNNAEVLESLNKTFSLATKANKQGLCNLLADRINTHNKHAWKLNASLKA